MIAFQCTESDIAQPVRLEEGALESLDRHTDEYKLLIGGESHGHVIRLSDFDFSAELTSGESRRSPSKLKKLWMSLRRKTGLSRGAEVCDVDACALNGTAPSGKADLQFVEKKPSELSLGVVGDRRVYNLAPVPPNKLFQAIQFESKEEGVENEWIQVL